MAPENAAWESVWLGDENTTEADGWLPAQWDVKYNELSVFEGKVTFGAINKDSDDIISSYVMSDFSGGGQIDLLTGADQSRYRHAIADTQSPGTLTLPAYVQDTGVPSAATGTTYPAYYIGDTVFGIWGTKVYPWDEDADTWGAGVTILEPSAKPTMFDSKVFIPNGSNGYTILSGATPTVTQVSGVATPTNSTDTTSPDVIDFEVSDGKLFALTTSGCLCFSFDGADNTWDWATHGWNSALGKFLTFDDSRPPMKLFTYADNNGDSCLHAATTRAVYRHDASGDKWELTTIQFAPHPDFGRAVAVWRPGEDLHIAVGLSKITYTAAGVIDPDQGLSRNDGMPYTNLGKISDLEPETSRLYACVSGSAFGVTSLTSSANYGSLGSGDDNYNTPSQIAVDSSGNLYVADTANNRMVKRNSSGVYQSQITSLTAVKGVAVDSSGNIYVSGGDGTVIYVKKYNSSLVLQWSQSGVPAGTNRFYHCATDGTSVWVCQGGASNVSTFACTTGTQTGNLGTGFEGAGDDEVDEPYGIATDGTYVYVVEQGNDRIHKFTAAGTHVSKWGSSGTGPGQFTVPAAIAVHPTTGNLYVTDTTNDAIQEFTNTGSYVNTLGSFTTATGIALNAAGTLLYVVDAADHRVEVYTVADAARQVPAVPSIHYWTGIGWHGAWELENEPDEQLTWGCIQSTSHTTDGYCYWFGCTNGKLYRIPLRRTFHNPRAGWQANYDRFAPTGYILTSRFDALMAGFYKKASRLVVYMDNATPDVDVNTPGENITIEYRVDIEDDNWIELGQATSTGRTILTFGNDGDGFSWGKRFNWIQFRIAMQRSDAEDQDQYQTPVIAAIVLNYTKLPQQARTFSFMIPFPKQEWNDRSGSDIEEHLSDMLAAPSYLKLVHRDRTYRGQLAAVAGITSLGQNYYGGATVNFIEIRTAD